MNRTDSINDDSSSKIDMAEQAVVRSVERFEHAMESLAKRVEESSHRVQHTIDLANKSKEDLMRIKDTFVSAVEPLQPYVNRVADGSVKLSHNVQTHPRSYALAVAAIFGAIALFGYFRSHNKGGQVDNRQLYGDLYGTRTDKSSMNVSVY